MFFFIKSDIVMLFESFCHIQTAQYQILMQKHNSLANSICKHITTSILTQAVLVFTEKAVPLQAYSR